MKKLLIILFLLNTFNINAQIFEDFFKYSTFYSSVNGGTSISDQNEFSVNTGLLQSNVVQTPYDYTVTFGVRKIQRFQYEPKTSFKDGTESSFNDAATIGRLRNKFEYLIEADVRRQEGQSYFDQHHMLRYVANKWLVKGEYLENGFADIKYFESSERYKYNVTKTLSFNIGCAQRLSEPYGYDPLEQWILSNGNLHYTCLLYTSDAADE